MNPRQEAEKIVEMFRKVLYDGKMYQAQYNDPSLMHDTKKCVDVSIKHVEGIISQLVYNDYLCSVNRDKWNAILEELKTM